jgi:glycine betaine/proline transport system substrate-binding protein
MLKGGAKCPNEDAQVLMTTKLGMKNPLGMVRPHRNNKTCQKYNKPVLRNLKMSVYQKIVAIFVMLFACAIARADEPKQIKLGTMGWEDLNTITLIGKRMLEKEGYKVEMTQFSEWGIAYSALIRGDIDLLVSEVNYVTVDYWKKSKERLEKVSVVSHGLSSGIVVPSYMKINSIEELNGIKDQVEGTIVGIEPGSGLMRELHEAVKQYGLDYKVIDSSTAAMTAELQSSLELKKPIVTVLWEPSWMMQKFDVKYLKDPKHVFAPPQSYYWIARKGFSAKNAHAREVLASVYVPIGDVTAMTTDIKNGATFEQAADNWWNKNTDLVSRWSELSKAD